MLALNAPVHLPITLKIRYVAAIIIIIRALSLAKMVRSSDAPLMIKKSIKIGGVNISILSNMRLES